MYSLPQCTHGYSGPQGRVPEPLLSSRSRRWNGILVELYRVRDVDFVKPVSSHVVTVFLRGPIDLQQRRNGRVVQRTMHAGDVIVAPAGEAKALQHREEAELVKLQLEPSFFAGITAGLDAIGARPVELLDNFGTRDAYIEDLARRLVGELRADNLGGRLYAESLATGLAVHLLRHYSTAGKIASGPSGMLPRFKLQRVTDYINDNLHDDLTLGQDVGDAVHERFPFRPRVQGDYRTRAASLCDPASHRPRQDLAVRNRSVDRGDRESGRILQPGQFLRRIPPAHRADAAQLSQQGMIATRHRQSGAWLSIPEKGYQAPTAQAATGSEPRVAVSIRLPYATLAARHSFASPKSSVARAKRSREDAGQLSRNKVFTNPALSKRSPSCGAISRSNIRKFQEIPTRKRKRGYARMTTLLRVRRYVVHDIPLSFPSMFMAAVSKWLPTIL